MLCIFTKGSTLYLKISPFASTSRHDVSPMVNDIAYSSSGREGVVGGSFGLSGQVEGGGDRRDRKILKDAMV